MRVTATVTAAGHRLRRIVNGLVNGVPRYTSTPMTVGQTLPINVSVVGNASLMLENTCASPRQAAGGPSVTAVWINPEVSN